MPRMLFLLAALFAGTQAHAVDVDDILKETMAQQRYLARLQFEAEARRLHNDIRQKRTVKAADLDFGADDYVVSPRNSTSPTLCDTVHMGGTSHTICTQP